MVKNMSQMSTSGLTTDSRYETTGRRSSWLGRLAPSAVFYVKILSVVWNASKLARKGRYTSQEWIKSSLTVVGALESVGVTLHVENLPAVRDLQTPGVFIGNHMSILETFVLPCLIQPYRDVTFVVKESLLEYPLFKHVMISREPVVVGRTNPRTDLHHVLAQGQERLQNGVSVIIFPQTTRSVTFDAKKFNSLGVKLAQRAGVPVIPIALKTDAWGLGKRLKDFGKIQPAESVHICFGSPFSVSGSGKAAHQFTVEFITEKLRSWGQPVLSDATGETL
jgi:1-acyl-sn-glycerol-3-phosphate acyltransferase